MADRAPQLMLEELEKLGIDSLGFYAQATIESIKKQMTSGIALSLNEGSELERIYEHYCQPQYKA